MKKKIGELYNKPIVIGDSNIVTDNEILLENKEDKVILYERQSPDGELIPITPDSSQSSKIRYNKFQVIGIKLEQPEGPTRASELPKSTVAGAINIDGHNGALDITFKDLFGEEGPTGFQYTYTFVPYDYYKVGDEIDERNLPIVNIMIIDEDYFDVVYGVFSPLQYLNELKLPCYVDFSLTTTEDFVAFLDSVPKIEIHAPDPI